GGGLARREGLQGGDDLPLRAQVETGDRLILRKVVELKADGRAAHLLVGEEDHEGDRPLLLRDAEGDVADGLVGRTRQRQVVIRHRELSQHAGVRAREDVTVGQLPLGGDDLHLIAAKGHDPHPLRLRRRRRRLRTGHHRDQCQRTTSESQHPATPLVRTSAPARHRRRRGARCLSMRHSLSYTRTCGVPSMDRPVTGRVVRKVRQISISWKRNSWWYWYAAIRACAGPRAGGRSGRSTPFSWWSRKLSCRTSGSQPRAPGGA